MLSGVCYGSRSLTRPQNTAGQPSMRSMTLHASPAGDAVYEQRSRLGTPFARQRNGSVSDMTPGMLLPQKSPPALVPERLVSSCAACDAQAAAITLLNYTASLNSLTARPSRRIVHLLCPSVQQLHEESV